MFYFSGPTVIGLLESSGEIFSWLLLTMNLQLHLSSGVEMILILDVDIWSWLCWAGFLVFGFFSTLCLLGPWDGCGSLNRKSSIWCGHCGSQVEFVSKNWNATCRNQEWLEVGGAERFYRREESWVCQEDLWIPQGIKEEGETSSCWWSAIRLGMRVGNWNKNMGKRLKITYMLVWQEEFPERLLECWHVIQMNAVRKEGCRR